jgi:phosphatidylserine decarboxylase
MLSNMLGRNLLFSEGRMILIVLLVAIFLGFLFFRPVFYISLGLLLFCLYFFRNPERVCREALTDQDIIVSPADGKVIDIQFDPHNGFEGYAYKVSIFLSVFDVHVNRMPSTGTIQKVFHKPGKFVPAYVPKSSELNERNDLVVLRDDGRTYIVRQIAGIIARRIRCWVHEGSRLAVGSRYGMIMFGSRVDILLPDSVELHITKGQRVYGGQTVIGRWLCK